MKHRSTTIKDILIKFQEYQREFKPMNANFADNGVAIKFLEKYNIDNNEIFPVKYEVGQEVYILNAKSVYKTKIDKIKITRRYPTEIRNAPENDIEDGKTGIKIEYLVVTSIEGYGDGGSHKIGFDWYNQRDIFSNREDLINSIK